MGQRSWTRREWAASVLGSGAAIAQTPRAEEATAREVYRILGFAAMNGEDPMRLWARLKPASEWLAGPLAPNGWSGQVFIAGHADIFGFRFLCLTDVWLTNLERGQRASATARNFEQWMKDWPRWWTEVGPRAPDDSYARLVWQMPDGGPLVTYEWARTDRAEIVGCIRCSKPAALALEAYIPWDSNPPQYASIYSEGPERRFVRGRSWVPGTRDGMRWVLATSQAAAETAGAGGVRWHGVYDVADALYFCGRQGQTYEALERQTGQWMDSGRIQALLKNNCEAYLRQRPEGGGWVADVPAAINDQLQWSEVYTPERRRAYVTVSRAWARANNSAPDFLWDSFLSAVLLAQEDEKKAFGLIRDITQWQNDQGMFVQYGQWPPHPNRSIFPVAWGHTQFPIGALTVAKIYLRRPDRRFLAEIYPRLLKNHRWWFRDRGDGQPWRDGNRNGLLELGANYPEEIPVVDREQVAYYESYDDSPQWWRVARFNEATGTIEQDTVERNMLYAMDCWILAWMAERLGRLQESAELRREHAQMRTRINALMWDAARGCYFNRRWKESDGSPFFPHIAPDVYYSLLAKVAGPEQAEPIRRLFHDPTKFGGEWLLPTISRDDPEYPKQHYWKGKVWGPVNWLVYQGMKIYDWDREAQMLAASSARMFLKPWREKGHCYENFLATTGEGSSDPHYTWGALMVQIAVEEIVDVSPWHGLRFGNLKPTEEASLLRYPVAGSLYDVKLGPGGLDVQRDGRRLFSADGPVELRQVQFQGNAVRAEVRAERPCRVAVGGGAAQAVATGPGRVSGTF